MGKRYFIDTYGCQMNDHDSEHIAGQLESDGMVATSSRDDADVVVINTCCIRENADNKLYAALGNLKALKRTKPDTKVVVAGCLAQRDGDDIIRRASHVDVVVGTHNVGRTATLLNEASSVGPVVEVWDEPADADERFASVLSRRPSAGHTAWVTIQVGCDNSCAFCIVPSVRGPELSRPFSEVVSEVTDLAAQGVTEVTLLGQNVNSYGRDLTLVARRELLEEAPEMSDVSSPGGSEAHLNRLGAVGHRWAEEVGHRPRSLFADLLREIDAIGAIQRVRYTSPHPKDMGDDVLDAMAECDSVCEHLHLPLQSGSDRILRSMRRGYTTERYLGIVSSARRRIDDLAVSTDIIVAFPGETEADFTQTLEVVAEAQYDSAYTFIYSPREGTSAYEMVDDYVSADVAKDRYARLRSVLERSMVANNRRRLGRIEEVVVEGPSKRDPARLTGRTRQNRLVHFDRVDGLRRGAYATVEVSEAGPYSLKGRYVEQIASPRHRIRIPIGQ